MIIIVAADKNWGIGYRNKLPWTIPGELAFLKKATMGNTVVMGRKTLESLPDGKPLKGRRNIVLTRDRTRTLQDVEFISSIDALKSITVDETVYVLGGEQIYRLLLPYCETAHVTKVDGIYKTDTFFPDLDADPSWVIDSMGETITAENGISYKRYVYKRTETKV